MTKKHSRKMAQGSVFYPNEAPIGGDSRHPPGMGALPREAHDSMLSSHFRGGARQSRALAGGVLCRQSLSVDVNRGVNDPLLCAQPDPRRAPGVVHATATAVRVRRCGTRSRSMFPRAIGRALSLNLQRTRLSKCGRRSARALHLEHALIGTTILLTQDR